MKMTFAGWLQWFRDLGTGRLAKEPITEAERKNKQPEPRKCTVTLTIKGPWTIESTGKIHDITACGGRLMLIGHIEFSMDGDTTILTLNYQEGNVIQFLPSS